MTPERKESKEPEKEKKDPKELEKEQEEFLRKAKGKLQLAKDRLMKRRPFHAAVINQMPCIARGGIGTMAVSFGSESIVLLYEPEFVATIPLKLLPGILQHEVNHIIFNHLLMTSKEYPNERALVIAEEVTVNEFVKEPLPDWVIRLEHYPDLPPMESTIERYKKLDKLYPMITIIIPVGSGDKGKGGGGNTHDSKDPDPGSEDGTKQDNIPQALDNHEVWKIAIPAPSDQEAQAANKTKEEMIEELLQETMAKVNPEEIPPDLQEACQQHGIDPGGMVESIVRRGKADPWTILRRYIGQATGIRPIFTRPPRRFPELVGVFPAYSRQVDKPRLLCCLDTSGSITSSMLSQMDTNLRVIGKDHEITIAEIDTMIYRTYKFKSSLKEVYGRGGTDLRPPFEDKFLKIHKPDLIIYFTDGYGPAPDNPSKVPTIWAILPYGQIPFGASSEKSISWGRVVFLKH